MASLLYESLHGSSKHHWLKSLHIWCRQMASLPCGSLHGSSNPNSVVMSSHNWCMQVASLLCESLHVSSNHQCLVTFDACKWNLSYVGSFMFLQITTLTNALSHFQGCSVVCIFMLSQIIFLGMPFQIKKNCR